MNMKQMVLGGCGILGLIAVVGVGATARTQEAKQVATRLSAQQALVEKIADSLIARQEKEARLKDQRAAHATTMVTAPHDLEESRKTLEVVKLSLKEYLEGTYPSDVQTAEGSIKLAESDLIKAKDGLEYAKKNRLAGAAIQRLDLARQKAEFSVEEAKNKLKVLKEFEKVRQTTLIQANIDKVEKEYRKLADLVAHGPEVEADLERQVQEESLSDPEIRALRLLEEVIALQDKRELDAAQAKLDEAAALWRIEEIRHATTRYRATKLRIHAAVKKLPAPTPKAR